MKNLYLLNMGRLVVFIFLFLLSFFSSAQIIENKVSDISITELSFRRSFIKENRIKSINAELTLKPDNKVIEDKGLVQLFEFDSSGKVIRHYYTKIKTEERTEKHFPAVYKKGRKIKPAFTKVDYYYIYDTVFTYFYYDSLQRLIIKRTDNGVFFDTFYYEYNSLSSITKEVHCKETNVGESRDNFKLGIQTVLSIERFEYDFLTATQLRKKCLNDEGKIYKQAIINYDGKGNRKDENYEFAISWLHIGNSFKYDGFGNLTEKTYTSDASGYVTEKSVYEYDSHKNLLSEKKFRNDIQSNEINYLYDENEKFLKSQLNRNFLKSNIGIVKYSYTLF